MVLSETNTGGRGRKVVALVDVRRAHFYAPSRKRAFVEVPQEDSEVGECGLLQGSLYGIKDVPQNWEKELASTIGTVTFKMTRTIGSGVPRQDDSTEVRDQETSGW